MDDLPGFRFHPTEEELLEFYLKRVAHGKKLSFDIIGTLNLYRYDPSELPGLAKVGEREWYFFVPRDRKSTHGGRPNRTTARGFWKATGSDRPIRSAADPRRVIGLRKTLVFYNGRAPHGRKTDWVMNEYRLPGDADSASPSPQENMVLCKVYRKATSLKEQEKRAVMEEYHPMGAEQGCVSSAGALSSASDQDFSAQKPAAALPVEETAMNVKKEAEVTSLPLPAVPEATPGKRNQPKLEMLEVPPRLTGLEWVAQEPFLTQLRSPWIDLWSPFNANVLSL